MGQVEDSGMGLTYLDARQYDLTLMRFLSPDPLMNPGDPRTLDAYRYGENNPVAFTDASGLFAACSGLSGSAEQKCLTSYYKGTSSAAPTPGKATTTYKAPSRSRSTTPAVPQGNGPIVPGPSSRKNALPDAVEVAFLMLVDIGKSQASQNLRRASFYDNDLLEETLRQGAKCYGVTVDANASGAAGCGTLIGVSLLSLPTSGTNLAVGVQQASFWKKGGANDAKIALSDKVAYFDDDDGRWIPGPNGSKYRQDIFGNWQFGAIYASAGISEETAIAVSNAGGNAGLRDPVDDEMIRLGFEFYELNSGSVTQEDVLDFFVSPGVIERLTRAGVYVA